MRWHGKLGLGLAFMIGGVEAQAQDVVIGPPVVIETVPEPAPKVPIWRNLGWIETEYNYRSTGPGQTFVAPVMDRFGDEFMFRQVAIRFEKPLEQCFSWGFNIQAYGGSDAAFLNPTAGAIIDRPDPRFGFDF